MNIDAVQSVVKTIRFPRGRFLVRHDPGDSVFEIAFRFRSRDVLEPRRRINAITVSQKFPMRDLDAWTPGLVAELSREIIHRTIRHEVDEWISVCGERPFNPHKADEAMHRDPARLHPVEGKGL